MNGVDGPGRAPDHYQTLRVAADTDARASRDYLVLTVASCAIATLGLIENSGAVIIGAMIIAPLMGPIQAFAFAALDGDVALLRRALTTSALGAAIAIAASALLGLVVFIPSYGSEVASRTRPNVLDLGIALAAGAVAGYARVRPSIGNAIAGTAIAVALMPPLCVVGLTLAHQDFSEATGAALLFGTNFLGIGLACMLVFLAAGQFRSHNRAALLATFLMTSGLVVPLGASTFEIVREAHIEAEIRHELTTNTVTFRQISLDAAKFDWYRSPLLVRLTVSAPTAVTPAQVADLEAFVRARTGRRVRLVLRVNTFETVTDGEAAPGDPKPATARGDVDPP